MPPANAESVLAFDVGLKRTGVATGQSLTRSAHPLASLSGKNGQLDWQELDRLLAEWQPRVCVVGDPKTDDPHLNKLIRRLIHHLQTHKIQIQRIDETLTSASANSELEGRGYSLTKKVELRDQIAACLILETYFAELGETTG